MIASNATLPALPLLPARRAKSNASRENRAGARTTGPRTEGPGQRQRRGALFIDCLRIVLTDLLNAGYRLRIIGRANIPAEGGALIIHNHVSAIDWLFVVITCPRLPRFVMHVSDYDRPGLRWLFDAAGVIPIAPRKEDPTLLAKADAAIDAALAAGDLVVICPEGKLTPDGELSPFRDGAARIARRCSVPVVPLAIAGLWEGAFSRKYGAPLTQRPRLGRASVRVFAGRPIPAKRATTAYLFEQVALLRGGRR